METKRDGGPSQSTDKIGEELIRKNVKTFRRYLEKAIMVKDLVGHFQLFTREQRSELLQIAKNNPARATKQALETIDQLSHPNRYVHLLEILDNAGYPKLVGLLKGKFVCLNDNHRMRLNEVTSSIYQRLNPSEAVPYLQQNGVISPEEAAEIRKVETNKSRSDAALELQYILPNRHRNWYELTIWSLVESKQVELAEIIDGALTYAILDGDAAKPHQCKAAISLQSLINTGSVETLTDSTQSKVEPHSSKNIPQDGLLKYRPSVSTAGHTEAFKFGDYCQNAYESSQFAELDAIFTQTDELKETMRKLLQNRHNGSIPLHETEESCRKKIEGFRKVMNNVLDKLEGYMYLLGDIHNHDFQSDQTQLKTVDAIQKQDKTVVNDKIVSQRAVDVYVSFIIADNVSQSLTARVSSPNQIENLTKVDTKLTDDESTPRITGCVFMPSGELVVCDYNNKKVKILDQSWKITDSVRLPCAPRDLSVVDDETVIVTIPSIRRLQYVQVFPKLKAGCSIQVDKQCRGIEMFHKDPYVSCHSSLVIMVKSRF